MSEFKKYLLEAPWPATRDDLIKYVEDPLVNAPYTLVEYLKQLDGSEEYESIDDICPDWDEGNEYLFDEDES